MNILFSVFRKIESVFVSFWIKTYSKIICGKNVQFIKLPFLLIHKNSSVEIGSNTLINSSNHNYHLNMFTKCKIYADRPNAFIKIGNNCRIHGTCIHAFKSIKIGNNCLIAANTQIIDGNGHQLCMDNPEKRLTHLDEGKGITIEDNVWIAANCIILGGSYIKQGSVIAAGSVVRGTVENNSVYAGNPAQLIKKFNYENSNSL